MNKATRTRLQNKYNIAIYNVNKYTAGMVKLSFTAANMKGVFEIYVLLGESISKAIEKNI